MADKITVGQLRVKCRFTFLSILHCGIHAKYGEHTVAEITGTVKRSEALAFFSDVTEDTVEIFSQDESGVEEVLFSGVMESVELGEEGQYASLSVRALSCTWKMDIERKNRSFQDLSMTYRDVAEQVIQEHDADMSWQLSDRPLEYPLIQYQETDFCFLKRIFSHLEESITPTDLQKKVCFCAGVRNGNHIGRIELNKKAHSILQFRGKKQIGYRIEGMDYVRVGDVLSIQGQACYVMEVEAVFRQNDLNCTCIVFPKRCFEVERISADTLRGAVITGKVLETKQEMVRLHLDIDNDQAVGTAYDFPWKPITGNLLYCMPEKGTKAALYFGKEEESSGAVIYNVRENGEKCSETVNPNDRYFTTDYDKRMYLKPSEAGLLNMTDQNAVVALKDGSSVQVKSSHQISILAEGQIELKGRSIKFTAPREATLVKRDILSSTVINMCNAFDAIGATGNFTAAPKTVKKKRTRIAGGQKIEKYSLNGVVEDVLSNIPADDMGSPVMEAVAASMPVVSKY